MPGRDLFATTRGGRTSSGGGGGRDLFANATHSTPGVVYAPKKRGHGLFHSIGHVVSQTASDVYNTAVSSPRGIYEAGRAVGHDVGAAARDVRRRPQDVFVLSAAEHLTYGGGLKRSHSATLGEAIARQMMEDVRHPLRHPGYTLMDILGAASLGAGSAARVGAFGRGLAETGNLGEAARAVRAVSEPKSLVMRAHGATTERAAARSVIARTAQKQINDLRNRFPDNRILGVRTQTQRVAKSLARERGIDLALRTAEARGLMYRGRKIKQMSPEGMAMRAVAEGTPPDVMITRFRADLKTADSLGRKRLTKQIALAEKAKKHVTADLKFTDPKLAELYARTEKVSLAADVSQAEHGLAAPETLQEAIHKPGRFYRQQPLSDQVGPPPPTPGQLSLPTGSQDLFQGGRMHVGYQFQDKPFAIHRSAGAGSANVVNTGRPLPSRLTHPFTGQGAAVGRIRHDVPRIVAENAIEAERHAAIIRAGQQIWGLAKQTPEGMKNPVPVKSPWAYGKTLPTAVRDLQDSYRAGRQLDENQTGVLGHAYETLRRQVFPDKTEIPVPAASDWPLIAAGDLPKYKNVRWIEQDMLGGLNKPAPLATLKTHEAGRVSLGFFDAVNNASKTAILYLKPAYAVPNIVGNAFLAITQQGWAAPRNIAAAVRMMRKLGPEDTALVDTLMGEGLTSALSGQGGSALAKTSQFLAGKYGKVVDIPFRRASFVYEARRELGRGTKWQEIRSLLHDEGKRPQLNHVAERANRALIDYGDLTPIEQDLVRRVLFFYPWLKGSTRYAADYVRDHPQQLALVTNTGQYGQEQTAQELGPLPSWAQGVFRVGGSDALPLTVNPNSAGVLSQPAQLAAIAAAALPGVNLPGGGYNLSELFTPGIAAGLSLATGQNAFGAQQPGSRGTTAAKGLVQGLPAVTLVNRLRGKTGPTYPMSKQQALLQFLIGGVSPRTTNRAKLNQGAAREKAGR